jgi:hypothetical protein
MSKLKSYKLPQEAANAVAQDKQPRIAIAIDQDGQKSEHVLYIDSAVTPAVQSCLLSDWKGPTVTLRWPPSS